MPETALTRGYILGFDFGRRRIGVSVGQATTRTATSLLTVKNDRTPDWVVLDRLVAEWKPGLLVVGLPLSEEGQETRMSKAARQFGAELNSRYSLEVVFADERHSSQAAGREFAEQRAGGHLKRKHASRLDAVAARIILENWLQSAHE
jgi:putative Holliday junction resolvase